jgi:hypothetical protein
VPVLATGGSLIGQTCRSSSRVIDELSLCAYRTDANHRVGISGPRSCVVQEHTRFDVILQLVLFVSCALLV